MRSPQDKHEFTFIDIHLSGILDFTDSELITRHKWGHLL